MAGKEKAMNEILTLVKRAFNDDGFTVKYEMHRDVFCRLASIGQSEFYQAQATSIRPEFKFVLADYLDYDGEYLCIYDSVWYRVVRTYRNGHELEIVVQRASDEEVSSDE
jgi:hypothetical protein